MDHSVMSEGDLTVEILSRLPVKSVLRFRCVCRRWLSLIDDRRFIRSHTLRQLHPTIAGFIQIPPFDFWKSDFNSYSLDGRTPSIPDPSLSFVFTDAGKHTQDEPCSIDDSCNGLLLCSVRSFSDYTFRRSIYVCNPTTMVLRHIPCPPVKFVHMLSLAFDPSTSTLRVVCFESLTGNRMQLWIYSPEIGSWRTSGAPFLDETFSHAPSRRTAFSRGALHWVTKQQHQWSQGTLLVFHVKDERLFTLPLPQTPLALNWNRNSCYLGESQARIHMIEYYGSCHGIPPSFEVFMMENDYSGWSLLYSINLNPLKDLYWEAFFDWENKMNKARNKSVSILPLCFHRGDDNEKDEDRQDYIFFCLPGMFASYDIKKKSCKKICNATHFPGDIFEGELFIPYAQTFFSP